MFRNPISVYFLLSITKTISTILRQLKKKSVRLWRASLLSFEAFLYSYVKDTSMSIYYDYYLIKNAVHKEKMINFNGSGYGQT